MSYAVTYCVVLFMLHALCECADSYSFAPPPRDTISVRWDGILYDCDFNQQLDMSMKRLGGSDSSRPLSIWDIQSLDELTGKAIRCDNHCYGCTAGSGSSCQGAVS